MGYDDAIGGLPVAVITGGALTVSSLGLAAAVAMVLLITGFACLAFRRANRHNRVIATS